MQRLYSTILLFLLLGCSALQAQVQPMFSQYMHDATVINPAYAGSAGALALTLQARMQWTQTAGAPAAQIMTAHTPLPGLPLSAGLRLLHEEVGSGRRMSVSPALVHRIRLRKGSISGGLSANINHYTPGYENLLLYHEADRAFTLRESVWVVTLGAGLYYATDKFYAGLSVPEIVPASRPDPEKSIFGRHLRQYAFHTGRVISLNHDIKLKPNLLLSVPEVGVAYADFNLNALFRETLWLGASYRTTNLLGGLVQVQLNDQWRLGYAWDMPLKGNHYYGADSHEISLQYVFNFDRSSVRSPRYF